MTPGPHPSRLCAAGSEKWSFPPPILDERGFRARLAADGGGSSTDGDGD